MISEDICIFHYAPFTLTPRPRSRYPVEKFPLLVSQASLLCKYPKRQIRTGRAATSAEILLGHSPQYVSAIKDCTLSEKYSKELGFVADEKLYIRGSRIVGSALEGCKAALAFGVSFVLGGGAHHSFHSYGRGFCIFNDVAIAAFWLLQQQLVKKIAIFDCDVHQGDGTAALCLENPAIETISLHGAKNYPFRKQKSSLDIAFNDGTTDTEYLQGLKRALAYLEQVEPDFMIYIAGADPFVEDKLGRLAISRLGLKQRDQLVFDYAYQHEIPVLVLFGGGYCSPIAQTVDLNMQSIRTAHEIYFTL